MKRQLRPRPAVTALPVCVSDLTSFDIVGLTAEQFRGLLKANPATPRTVIGHRLIVKVTDLLALLDSLATAAQICAASQDDAVATIIDDQPSDEADVLARLGFRRSA